MVDCNFAEMKQIKFFKSMMHREASRRSEGRRKSLAKGVKRVAEAIGSVACTSILDHEAHSTSRLTNRRELKSAGDHLKLGMHNFRKLERDSMSSLVLSTRKAGVLPLSKDSKTFVKSRRQVRSGKKGSLIPLLSHASGMATLPFSKSARRSEERRLKRGKRHIKCALLSSKSDGPSIQEKPVKVSGSTHPLVNKKGVRLTTSSVRGHDAGLFWVKRWIARTGEKLYGKPPKYLLPANNPSFWTTRDWNKKDGSYALDGKIFRILFIIFPNPKHIRSRGFTPKGATRKDRRRSFAQHYAVKPVPVAEWRKLAKNQKRKCMSRALGAWKKRKPLPHKWWTNPKPTPKKEIRPFFSNSAAAWRSVSGQMLFDSRIRHISLLKNRVFN